MIQTITYKLTFGAKVFWKTYTYFSNLLLEWSGVPKSIACKVAEFWNQAAWVQKQTLLL